MIGECELWFECEMVGVRFWSASVVGTFSQCLAVAHMPRNRGTSWHIKSLQCPNIVLARSKFGSDLGVSESAS